VDAVVAWTTLTATLVLVGVTAWYAWLTRRIAEASKEAALSALAAAQASNRAADAAVAAVPIDVEISPYYFGSISEMHSDAINHFGVMLRSAGSTLFVHAMRLDYAGKPVNYIGRGRYNETIGAYKLELVPASGLLLPVRLHSGETAQFRLPTTFDDRFDVATMIVTIFYTLDGTSSPIPREVEYQGRAGSDFDWPHPTLHKDDLARSDVRPRTLTAALPLSLERQVWHARSALARWLSRLSAWLRRG
jgi:hypothetical protein